MAVKVSRFEMPKRLIKDEKSATDTYAKFVAEPFESGFGHTIGNSLRRMLLSSLEGAAISAVSISGVQHEFSTIKGVVEDVAEVILNLKRVLVVSHSRTPRRLTLEVKKKGEITAGQIRTDGTVEILNPEHHIATLNQDAKIAMELEVRVGRGYVPAELNKGPDHPIGLIAVDALFSPVRKVKYYVEETRVGQQFNYDRLVIEVWTDGRIKPEEALKQASAVLRKHLDVFVDYDEHYVEFEEDRRPEQDESKRQRELLSKSINEIELGVRAANCIEKAGIRTIGDLVRKTEQEMLKYRNFGKKSLAEIKDKLSQIGLSLGMKVDEPAEPEEEAQE